jgi:hypothetical protein
MTTTTKYRYLIVDAEGEAEGTDSLEVAEAHAESNCVFFDMTEEFDEAVMPQDDDSDSDSD